MARHTNGRSMGHPTLHDDVFETELLTCTSMRPIHQVCLDMEHVRVAMMYRLARKLCEPRDISAFVTDAIVCHPSNAQRKKLEAATLAYKHPDGTGFASNQIRTSSSVQAIRPLRPILSSLHERRRGSTTSWTMLRVRRVPL